MTQAMQRQARAVRARAAIRRWEFRQRRLSHGVWFRLRSLLAGAREAWAIPEEAMAALLAAGHVPEAVGAELQPPKTIVKVSARDLPAERRPLAMHLDPAMLETRFIALVPF